MCDQTCEKINICYASVKITFVSIFSGKCIFERDKTNDLSLKYLLMLVELTIMLYLIE